MTSASKISQPSSFYVHETDLQTSRFSIRSTLLPLELRVVQYSDRGSLLRHYSLEENVQYDASVSGLNTLEAIDGLIEQWRCFEPLERVNAVVLAEGEFIGTGGLGWIGRKREPDGRRVGDAGIMLNPEARGKGYAYEALRISIDYGFEVLGLEVVELACRDENTAMRGLMDRKFGWKARRIQDERFGNDWLWSIGKEEWKEHQASK
jgi:RimJ/RimL family protein N-acetyltransferase